MAFSKAAGSPADTTVHTSEQGLQGGDIGIPVGDAVLPAYYALPEGRRGLPVVLVVQEIFGVHEHIKDVCRRLAHAGYFAIAPELYFRQGDASTYDDIPTLFGEIVNKVPDAQVMGDLDAALAWAGTLGADTSRAALTGFCWGGRVTWLYCAHSEQVRCGVAWYGRLEGDRNELRPRQPLDLAGALKAPVLALYGGRDDGIPLDQVERMKRALAQGSAAARASSFVVYPDAPHAFYADYRPSYRADAAADGWQRMLAYFQEKLGA
ncbi:dienelactone hydrolase family protein [Verticiella sediminum]|uniref:Dienelactone hydrolase family protein n=1 Tax=Verticiella sediminum TaxID=1247510 RepID=A0A556ABP0_9BURK|nr:dienelactone hydrolase family protein [Verticiella sediminum]TSH90290.1 dienelactone hydrolase family protein [Verticiella sediminum]